MYVMLCMYVMYVCMYVCNVMLCMYVMYVCMYVCYVVYVCNVCMYVCMSCGLYFYSYEKKILHFRCQLNTDFIDTTVQNPLK